MSAVLIQHKLPPIDSSAQATMRSAELVDLQKLRLEQEILQELELYATSASGFQVLVDNFTLASMINGEAASKLTCIKCVMCKIVDKLTMIIGSGVWPLPWWASFAKWIPRSLNSSADRLAFMGLERSQSVRE